mgnify:CR=1 FL=1|jgi:elongation factor P
MKTNANSVKIGNVIEYQNQLWKVAKRDHVKPGKGGAYIQVEMKNIKTGNKTNVRFSSSEDIEVAYVEQKNFQFQYFDQDDLVLMDMESFETVNISNDLLGESLPFLEDGMNIRIEYCNDEAVSAYLPEQIKVKIKQADAVVKGQTATSSYKPAVLENDVKIMVPQFIESGEEIIIKTDDFSYVSRAK